MGIFSRALKTIGTASGQVLGAVGETFVNPVVRAGLTLPVTGVRAIQGLVPGGKTGNESMQTPFGEVKPLANLANRTSREAPGTLKPMEALGQAAELALTVPGVPLKLAGSGLKVAKKLAGPLAEPIANIVTKTGEALKGSAVKAFGEALAPTTSKLKAATARVTPQALKEGVFGTLKSISKTAKKGLEEAGQKIEDFGELVGSAETGKVLKVFDDAKSEFQVKGVAVNQNALNAIDEISGVVKGLADKTGNIGLEDLRAVRRIWDQQISDAGGFLGKTLKEGSDIAIKKLGANAIRKVLADEIPDLAKLNAKYNFYQNLLDIAEATGARKVGQSGLIRKGIGATVGALTSKVLPDIIPLKEAAGAFAGEKLAQIGGSTLFKSLSAQAKNKLADALIDGEHSIEKIAGWMSKAAYPTLKMKDFVGFLNKEAKKTEEENQQALSEHDQRIKDLQDRIFGASGSSTTSGSKIQEIRERLGITN